LIAAGAVSTRGIVSMDGYVEVMASETTTHRMIGLSRGDTNQGYPDIDFALYLAALRDGRAVVAVHAPETALRGRVVERLNALGAHFLNFYGRVATEEITRWRGEELPLPGWLRR